jgi:hypothetical protein
MRKECICCRRPMARTMLDASDMCALCSHETSAWLDKFTRGESVEGHEHHIVAGLFILAFGLMLGAGLTWMVRLL